MNMIARLPDEMRGGLPPWTYFSERLFQRERDVLFRRHWQLACHVSDVPKAGDWCTFDMLGERALITRGQDGAIRAFHNVCRHRGSRVAAEEKGHCKSALVCPFHGWSYGLDGSLRAVPQSKTFPKLDPKAHGLPPLESEVWQGFVFVRFAEGPQDSVASMMEQHADDIAPLGVADYVPVEPIAKHLMPVNWKSVRDVDNEGYHVAVAHPALHDLYGHDYRDGRIQNGVQRSYGRISGNDPSFWSVRNYMKHRPLRADVPEASRMTWVYLGLFPNTVIMVYPETVGFYQEVPVSPGKTYQRLGYYGRPEASREERLARYLALRIDRMTGAEDEQLIQWSWEGMQSSGFKDLILSDLEGGVRDWHDNYRSLLPEARMTQEPVPASALSQ